VGGTIHVIVNNQIGFTTTPDSARSGFYSSDLAKAINAPIFHVNADSVEDVTRVFEAAAEYRQKYRHDVVIDLIGYRKFGHNELDQPSFTNPFMYKQVAKMQPVARIYEKQLLEEGVITSEKLTSMKQDINTLLEDYYQKSKSLSYKAEDWMTPEWHSIKDVDVKKQIFSGVPAAKLRDYGEKISVLPKDQKFHRLVMKIFEARYQSIMNGKDIDWGTAEALAFASLLDDGYIVRISGQDVERGTFSHRHAHVFY
jgi:2-oxoglutarate dehydrogenase E1 component